MGASRLVLAAGIFLVAACGGSATASLQLHNATASSAARASGVTGPGAETLVVPVSPSWLGLRLLAVYLTADGAAQGDVEGGALLWLNPECDGDAAGCDLDGASGVGPRVRNYLNFAQGSDAVNAVLGAEARAIAPGTYRSITLQFCKLPQGRHPRLPGVQWWLPGMAAASSFTTAECALESQAFGQPLQVAAGGQVEVTLDYDLSTAVFSGKPAYNVQCLEAPGENACFSDCADFGGSRTCAGVPALAARASTNR